MPEVYAGIQAQVRESNAIVAASAVYRCHCRGRVGGYVWFFSRTKTLPTLADRVFPLGVAVVHPTVSSEKLQVALDGIGRRR